MNTIKNIGLHNIIEQGDIYNDQYHIEDILSEDLTAEEIEESQAIIKCAVPRIKEVMEKLNPLYEQIHQLNTQIETLSKSISNTGCGIVVICCMFPITLVILQMVSFFIFDRSGGLLGGLLAIGFLGYLLFSVSHIVKGRRHLAVIKQELILPEKEKKDLLKSISAPSFWGIEQGLLRLDVLSKLLQKLYLIITDTHNSQTGRLLAIENFFYLLHKKRADEELVAEAKKSTYYAQQQMELQQANARELEKQTEIIREKARLDESRKKDGEPWRF